MTPAELQKRLIEVQRQLSEVQKNLEQIQNNINEALKPEQRDFSFAPFEFYVTVLDPVAKAAIAGQSLEQLRVMLGIAAYRQNRDRRKEVAETAQVTPETVYRWHVKELERRKELQSK